MRQRSTSSRKAAAEQGSDQERLLSVNAELEKSRAKSPLSVMLMIAVTFTLALLLFVSAQRPVSSLLATNHKNATAELLLLFNASLIYSLAGAGRPPFAYNVAVVHGGGVLVHGNVIEKVYRSKESLAFAMNILGGNGRLRLADLQGGYLYPGFSDAHGHLFQLASALDLPNLVNCRSIKSVRHVLREYVDKIVAREKALDPTNVFNSNRWLMGIGWYTVLPLHIRYAINSYLHCKRDQTKWTPAQFPTKDDLDIDPVLRNIPILLQRVDAHVYWINQRTLDLIDKDRIKPGTIVLGGEIIRDRITQQPTGVFIDNAMDIIERKIPISTPDQFKRQLKLAVHELHKWGVTSMHEAGLLPVYFPLLESLAADTDPTTAVFDIRQYLMIRCPESTSLPHSSEYIATSYPRYCGDHPNILNSHKNVGNKLIVRSVKLFLDGALGSFGASLIEPYSDNRNVSGYIRCKDTDHCTEFAGVVEEWTRKGFQVNTHAIGDRANKIALDGYEHVIRKLRREGKNVDDLRFRIEHAQIMRPEGIQRCAKLGVIPSMQPTHESRLGPVRIKGAYAWQSLLKAGVPVLPLGSDFPVEPVNPLLGFYSAITRKHFDGAWPGDPSSDGWYPEQKLTRAQTLFGFTLSAAYVSFQEHKLGSIEPGKLADFVVFDKDIMTIPEQEILQASVQGTFFGGKCVYGALCK